MKELTTESFLSIFKRSSPVMLLIDPDDGRVVDANQSASDFYGYPLEKLIGLCTHDINTLTPKQIQLEQQRALKEERNAFNFSHKLASGEVRDVEVYSSPIILEGKSLLFSIVHDVTEQRIAQEALAQRELLLKQILDTSSVAIFLVDQQGRIIHANHRMTEMFGYTMEDLLTKEYVELINPQEREIGRAKMLELLARKIPSVDLERAYWRADNSEFWGHLSGKRLYGVKGDEAGLVGVIADITEMKNYQKQLEQVAHYDMLTHLPNRVLFFDRLKHSIEKSQKAHTLLAIVYIDLDGFKVINDNYGHDVGDKFLVAIAQHMKATLREGDTLSRLGGDEFVATLVDLNAQNDCYIAVERLLMAARDSLCIEDKVLQASASIGVAIYPTHSEDADQLMRYADQTMYKAKQSGKNRYCLFEKNN